VNPVKSNTSESAAMSKSSDVESNLTLGWQVTPGLDPRYWLSANPKPGAQTDADLVRVASSTMASHTVIVAQSGSGKSYFLGRLIEELMLRTMARVLIFDPNADFRRVIEVVDDSLWNQSEPYYDAITQRGRLTGESSRKDFASGWSNVPIKILSGGKVDAEHFEALQLWWPSISTGFLAEDVPPILRNDIYHCHAFVKMIGQLYAIVDKVDSRSTKKVNLLSEARDVIRETRNRSEIEVRDYLEKKFDVKESEITSKMKMGESPFKFGFLFPVLGIGSSFTRQARKGLVRRLIERSVTARTFISEEIERFYFGKAHAVMDSRILAHGATEPESGPPARLSVIDLPSLKDKATRLLAVSSLLETEWNRARYTWGEALQKPRDKDDRVPSFIVVDEAHNLIPKDTTGTADAALREQFRIVAAEGRKYGIFLILVSQRPDKLDPLVVSECENKAVMRLGSASVLGITREMLGLDDVLNRPGFAGGSNS